MDWSQRFAFRVSKPQKREERVHEERGSIFDIRGHDRLLRVVMSTEVEEQDADSRGALTIGLMKSQLVEVVRYADDGPPSDAELVDNAPWGVAVDGWLTVELTRDRYMASLGSCTYVTKTGIHRGSLGGADAVNLAIGHDSRGGAPAPDFMATPAGRAAVALRAALGAQADILLTERAELHPPHRYLRRTSVEVLRPADALPLLSLYLRSRGSYVVDASGGRTYTIEPPLFWRQATLALAPGLERALRRAAAADDLTLPVSRGLSGIQARIALALEARDRVLRACLVHPHAKPADAAAPAIDYLMLSIGAALDSLGKLVHHTLGVPGDDVRVSWTRDGGGSKGRRTSWLRDLKLVEGGAQVRRIAKTEKFVHFHTIFSQLRNSIHGAAPESVPASDDELHHHADRTLVRLVVRDVDQLLTSCAHLHGRDYWSIWRLQPPERSSVVVDPAVVGDHLINYAISFIDAVLDEVGAPDAPMGDQLVAPPVATRLRWIIGLHDPSPTSD